MEAFMTTGRLDPRDWTEILAESLSRLASEQERYRDELFWRRQESARSESEAFQSLAADHPFYELLSFYSHACREGRYFEERYGPLRVALAKVRGVLAAHPAWAGILGPANGREAFWFQIATHGGLRTLDRVIAGLVARGLEVGENGFKAASSELNTLLGADQEPERDKVAGDLSIGYHVALFHGLLIVDDLPIAEDMTVVPLKQLSAFVNQSVLQDVAPNIVKYNGWDSVGAIIKPFRWKPEFRERSGDSDPELDWGGSFFDDVEDFVELLAMFHAAPVVCLVNIPYCIHRTASHLLGEAHYHGGYSPGRSAGTFNSLRGSIDVEMDAFDEARKAFGNRGINRYQECAPVIARLAEALARSGRFAADDKILDVAIALERMYGLEGGEISFKLKTMAACFLESDTTGRLQVFQDVAGFYDIRSSIVHKGRKQKSAGEKADAFAKGFEVARRSAAKLLQDGPPQNWNKMVLEAPHKASPGSQKPGSCG